MYGVSVTEGRVARRPAPRLQMARPLPVGHARDAHGLVGGGHESGIALAQLVALEVERAEAHKHAVDHGVGAKVTMALVASQAERVERGVVQVLGGEPGTNDGHVAQAH